MTAKVALLTAGRDKPYALGLAGALIERGIEFEFIGSDELDARELRGSPYITVRNLRGDQSTGASLGRRIKRVVTYYFRLMRYAATSPVPVLHVLWNNKFELFDRTILMLYYRALGKKIVLTAHNINTAQRDGIDTWLNRATLKLQYRLAHHVFVHTSKMKLELQQGFGVAASKVTLIPFGINNTLPKTELTGTEARKRLGLEATHRAILFFGNIAPYKGLDCLVAAFAELAKETSTYRLIIAGRPKGCEAYWDGIRTEIARQGLSDSVIERIAYVPDEDVEVYFKAADVLALPYTNIYQSGVLFLGYSFGLPVVATDVGAFAEDIVEGETGLVCRSGIPSDFAQALRSYFESPLYQELDSRRRRIEAFANDRFSWTKVGVLTEQVYGRLGGPPSSQGKGRPSAPGRGRTTGSCERHVHPD